MGAESIPSPDAVRAQLRKVLESKQFRSSELPKKFLTFIVVKTLEDQAAEIKEYSIGVDGFGRGGDFDPRIDSVVRVVARRVRDRLAEYYRHEGKSDSLVIRVPTGSYIPSFSRREPAEIAGSPTPESPSPRDSDDLIGRTVSHYEILELIGRGSSGIVYRAEDLRLKRGIAFKVLCPEFASDSPRLERFMREARSASAVNHPNVCAIYDVGEVEGRAFIVMELVEGKTLGRFIDGKPLEIEALLDLGIQIADALVLTHSQGIVHSDVRSANIIVNGRCQAKLLDFSAAEAIREDSSPPRVADFDAAPAASPLPAMRPPGQADIVGMGVILFEMATGRAYAKDSNLSVRLLNPVISPELDRLVQQAIASGPDLRTISDVRDELRRLKRSLEQEGLSAGATRRGVFQALAASKWAWMGALASVTLLVLIYLWSKPVPPPKVLSYTQLTHDGQSKLNAFAVGTPAPLLTDGARIYFNEISGSQVAIKEVSALGGETVLFGESLNQPLVAMNISPNGSQLLSISYFQQSPDHELFTLALPGGIARPLGEVVGHDGAWSPDGKRVCYAEGNRLYLAGEDGTGSKLLAELPGLPSWLRWSPDGTRLRVTVQDATAGTSLWEVALNDPQPRPVFPDWKEHLADCCGSWSPDGKYFIFQSTSDGSAGVWAIREQRWRLGDSHVSRIRLTQGPVDVWAPVFSADGHKIFAVVQQRRGELVRFNPTSHDFALYLNGISADHVEFSKDAQWIAYCAYPDQTIWRSRPDASERLQLSFAPMAAIFPRWSPDGRRIAFMGTIPGKAVKIYIVSSNGGNPEPLLQDDSPEIDPNWSPDGNTIMFAKLTSATELGSDSVIETYDPKSRRLSSLPGSEGLTAPRWSPDGRFVVATALSQGKWRKPAVVIFDFKTGKWSGLENDPIDNKWWSSDGKYFIFDKSQDNDPAIYRLRLSDRSIERIASLKDVRRSFNIMGWWMGLTPGGDPLVLRDTSIEEIYALNWAEP
jgi:eukaryotic-like serine/threonine-protein kinase